MGIAAVHNDQFDKNHHPICFWLGLFPGARVTWMKTIQQDLRSNNLSLDEAITVAQNRPLWRLMFAFGATHP